MLAKFTTIQSFALKGSSRKERAGRAKRKGKEKGRGEEELEGTRSREGRIAETSGDNKETDDGRRIKGKRAPPSPRPSRPGNNTANREHPTTTEEKEEGEEEEEDEEEEEHAHTETQKRGRQRGQRDTAVVG